MGRLGVVGGHSILDSGYGAAGERRDVVLDGVAVTVLDAGSHVVVHRHGLDTYTPAHRVVHASNVQALVAAGCDRVLGVSSVGGLRPELGVGTLLAPDDFIALDVVVSVHHDARSHVVPGFDAAWRARVLDAAHRHGHEHVRDGGVYWQAQGPRFETRAEIRMIAQFADVVGMTAASECVVAQELGVPYAVVCVVDNLANGVAESPLTWEEFEAGKRATRDGVLALLDAVVPVLAARERAREMSTLAITGAVTPEGAPTALRAVDGVVAEVGAHVDVQPGDEHIDAGGDVLLRALVNGHTHAAMTLFRGYGGDLPLMQWLEEKIWPAEARLTDEAVYWGTRLACIEMIRSGTVRFWDMYWRPVAVAHAAARDAGIAAAVGPPLIDGLDRDRSAAACAEAGAMLDELRDVSPDVQPCLAPHGIYTASDVTLAWAAEQSDRLGVPVHLHFLETADEVSGCVERTGERPAAYLTRLGLLSERLVLAHGVWMDEPELELVAASGATVVTNPVSNLKLAVGRIFPYSRARHHGIPVGLGTDGASSNNSLDLLDDVKVLALLQKFADDDPASLPAAEAWAVATGALAPLLVDGVDPAAADVQAGDGQPRDLQPRDLQVGDRADCFLARHDAPALAPGHVLDNLVYAATASVVRTTVAGGRVVMRDGVVEGEEEVRAHVVECARRLGVL